MGEIRVIRFYSVTDAYGAFSDFASYPIRCDWNSLGRILLETRARLLALGVGS